MQRRTETLPVAAKGQKRRVGFEGVSDGLGRVRHCINNDVLVFTDLATNSVKNVPLEHLGVAYVLNGSRNLIGCRDGVACRLPCYIRHLCSCSVSLSPPSRLCCAFMDPSELALITISSIDSTSLLLTFDLTAPGWKAALPKQSNGTVLSSLVWCFGSLDASAVSVGSCRSRRGRLRAR